MINRIEAFQKAHPDMPFIEFCICFYMHINPDFSKALNKNFSWLEAIAGFIGRFLLLEDGRPDLNILYFYALLLAIHNKRGRNICCQVARNPYDFVEVRKPNKRNPEGHVIIRTYRFVEPLRGDIAVDLKQLDLNATREGLDSTESRIQYSRDTKAVDIRIAEILRAWGLIR